MSLRRLPVKNLQRNKNIAWAARAYACSMHLDLRAAMPFFPCAWFCLIRAEAVGLCVLAASVGARPLRQGRDVYAGGWERAPRSPKQGLIRGLPRDYLGSPPPPPSPPARMSLQVFVCACCSIIQFLGVPCATFVLISLAKSASSIGFLFLTVLRLHR